MLYRITPLNEVSWCDMPSRGLLELAEENAVDLARLSWAPAEARAFSNDLLRLALRYGIPCSDGVVVSAIDVVDLGRSDELRLLNHRSSEVHRELRAQHPFMEHLIPGWTEHGEELDGRVSESMDRAAQAAEDDLGQQLAAAPKPEVVAHWSRLGGDLPHPI